jgi:hypothetical protein
MPGPAAAPIKKRKPHLLGGDPEVFIRDRKTGGIVPSCGRIGGLKGAGVPISETGGYKVKALEDNVAVEFNFAPFSDQYTGADCVRTICDRGNEWLKTRGYEMVPICEHEFTESQLSTPKAQVFGCDPDFVAYDTSDQLRTVDALVVGNHRFCGGHLHFGFENPDKIPHAALAILIDMFVGLPSLIFDQQSRRRKWYGLAGLYRPKPYGLEYRTMSNWWLRVENFDYMHRMFRECFQLMHCFDNQPQELGKLFEKMPLKDIQVVINDENKKLGYEVWTQARSYAEDAGMHLGLHFNYMYKNK